MTAVRPTADDDRLVPTAARVERSAELLAILRQHSWFVHAVGVACEINAPDWWISAGVIRDIVWGARFGKGFDPRQVKDLDLGFFDPRDLTEDRDLAVEAALKARDPTLAWDAKNQASVHLWYPARFGVEVMPFGSAAEAIATFPEFCTCVGVRWAASSGWDVAAPYGLDDLLGGVWRRNPARVTLDEYGARLERKQPSSRWPGVRVIKSGSLT